MATNNLCSEKLLFCEFDWQQISKTKTNALHFEIDRIPADQLLNMSVDDLAEYLVEKYQIQVPDIDERGINVDHREAQIDVSQDTSRYIVDRSQPFFIPGTSIIATVPFCGDYNMFCVQPTTRDFNPPRAVIHEDCLILKITGANPTVEQVRAEIKRRLSSISLYLERQRLDSKTFNDQLPARILNHIHSRRKRLLADRNLVAELGFPIKQRPETPRTYKAPEVRRRMKTAMPTASTKPYKPEPTLDIVEYEHILSIITNMVHVMERSPSTFESLDEEALRSHFLVQLNGHYEGQATGETFNYEGKTDILIRVDDRNVFIAECKYWDGPKSLTEAINQILGYASWRDTKTAIIIFNRRKNFSRVLKTIPKTMHDHPNCKRELDQASDSTFKYTFAHRDDPNRELLLTVFVFDVPTKATPNES